MTVCTRWKFAEKGGQGSIFRLKVCVSGRCGSRSDRPGRMRTFVPGTPLPKLLVSGGVKGYDSLKAMQFVPVEKGRRSPGKLQSPM